MFNVVDQRVHQNNSTFIEAEFNFFYESGKKVTLVDVESLFSYRDTENSECKGFAFLVKYMVLFPPLDSPEIQEIRVDLFKDPTIQNRFKLGSSKPQPQISYSIEATNVTWAQDIHGVLLSEISSYFTTARFLKIPISVVRELFVGLCGVVGVFSSFILFFVGVATERKIEITKETARISQIKSVPSNTLEGIGAKIDLLASSISVEPIGGSILLVVITILVAAGNMILLVQYGKFFAPLFYLETNSVTISLAKKSRQRRSIWLIPIDLATLVGLGTAILVELGKRVVEGG